MRLLRVELTRLRWRRAVWLLVLAVVLVTAAVVAILVYDSRPRSGPDDYYSPLDLAAVLSDTSVAVGALVTAVGILIGTTFAGHDWTTGSMSNQLLFEPRRQQVWWAKAIVIALVTGALSVLVLAGFWAVLVLVAHQRDLATPGIGSAILHQTLRLTLFTMLLSVVGYALTMAFRSTVATLGFLFAVTVAGPILLAAVSAPLEIQPQNHFLAIAQDGWEGYDYSSEDCFDYETSFDDRGNPIDTGSNPCYVSLDQHEGWVYFGVLGAVVVVGSTVSFGRRDVG